MYSSSEKMTYKVFPLPKLCRDTYLAIGRSVGIKFGNFSEDGACVKVLLLGIGDGTCRMQRLSSEDQIHAETIGCAFHQRAEIIHVLIGIVGKKNQRCATRIEIQLT